MGAGTGKVADARASSRIGTVLEHVIRLPLKASSGAGGILAWHNPHSVAIIITRVVINITTASSGSTAADVGTAANLNTSADNLLDGVAINATGTFDNIEDRGTNGKSRQKLDAIGHTTDYITISAPTGTPTGLVGYAYIYYTEAPTT